MTAKGNNVRVFVRVRPTDNFAQDTIRVGEDNKTINVHIKKDTKFTVVNNQRSDWSFKMDGFLHNTSQDAVYDIVARPVISKALDGYNGTIMCYGQTGAGKTYTITGATESYDHRGIIPRALQQVFREIETRPNYAITVRVSYLEIYNETLFDLLSTLPDVMSSDTQIVIKDDSRGVHVKGLSVHLTTNEEDALNLLFEGETNRVIASHILNKNSSRSHCIFTIYIESRMRSFSDAKYISSKINLVDLAGSERLKKTGSEGQVLREASYINRSLSFLEQTILALTDRKREHIPFRQCKLTYALKDSLGGKCNTILVANIYGEEMQLEETLSSLRFATRMKCIPAEPEIIQYYDPVLSMKNLEKEINLLKQELALHDILANRGQMFYEPLNETQIAEINRQARRYLAGTLTEIDIINLRQLQEVFAQFRLILSQQEQEVEARLREKYTLIDKKDLETIAAAQKAGLLDEEGQLVGELDGQGFGVGLAPPSSKPLTSTIKKTKSRKSKERSSPPGRKESFTSPPAGKEPVSISPSKSIQMVASTKDLEIKDSLGKDVEIISIEAHRSELMLKEEISRPGTPPTREVAFEEFKNERGSEINRIFKEDKAILIDRKKRIAEITQRINVIKREIDATKQNLAIKKHERETQGEYISDAGQTIIDEEEFMLIVKLKDLKKQYRSDFEELQNLKAEIQYCQRLVDQCRQRLLSEFEIWYNESFLIPEDTQIVLKVGGSIRPGMIPISKISPLGEDDQDRFEHLQQTLSLDNPNALSFYNAKMKVGHRAELHVANHVKAHCWSMAALVPICEQSSWRRSAGLQHGVHITLQFGLGWPMQLQHIYNKAMSHLVPARKKAGLITTCVKNKPPTVLSVA
ncbi:kinesin-like protein KIF9 isoform X3 [Rhinatrema bivittatum]|nr:kinesin-like protein KIF9 isoform X3 [Rhinatrema bivittatum]XP_029444114.1 kinesin-like protein KIF9 isoform X3 [Rhinatrema bivittatum]